MPNVQLPPKESNLFKRILVSGRRPRCRSPGAPGPARRAVWRGRLRWPARLPHGSLFSSEPARPQCPPRLGPAGPPASPAGRRGHRACPRASSLRSGSPGPRRAPSRNFTSPSAVPGRGRAGQVVAPVPAAEPAADSPPPRSGLRSLVLSPACPRRGVHSLLCVSAAAPHAPMPRKAGAVLGWRGARLYAGYGKN